jgi:hypothetical protein
MSLLVGGTEGIVYPRRPLTRSESMPRGPVRIPGDGQEDGSKRRIEL